MSPNWKSLPENFTLWRAIWERSSLRFQEKGFTNYFLVFFFLHCILRSRKNNFSEMSSSNLIVITLHHFSSQFLFLEFFISFGWCHTFFHKQIEEHWTFFRLGRSEWLNNMIIISLWEDITYDKELYHYFPNGIRKWIIFAISSYIQIYTKAYFDHNRHFLYYIQRVYWRFFLELLRML